MNTSNVVEKIRALEFFSTDTRSVSDEEETIQVNNYMLHLLYEDLDSPDVINSIMVLRGGYREPGEGKRPGYSMVTTKNAIAKYDVDEAKIVVTVAANGSHPGCTVEFDSTCGEDAFFQESLVTDMAGVTYEFLKLARDVVDVVEELDDADVL